MATVASLIQRLVSRADIGTLEVKMQNGRVRSNEGRKGQREMDVSDVGDLRVLLVTPKSYILLTTSLNPVVPGKDTVIEEIGGEE